MIEVGVDRISFSQRTLERVTGPPIYNIHDWTKLMTYSFKRDPVNKFGRKLITSYKDRDNVMKRYPRREVLADMDSPNDSVWYFNPRGRVRRLNLIDNSIWETDLERGFPFMRRIK